MKDLKTSLIVSELCARALVEASEEQLGAVAASILDGLILRQYLTRMVAFERGDELTIACLSKIFRRVVCVMSPIEVRTFFFGGFQSMAQIQMPSGPRTCRNLIILESCAKPQRRQLRPTEVVVWLWKWDSGRAQLLLVWGNDGWSENNNGEEAPNADTAWQFRMWMGL